MQVYKITKDGFRFQELDLEVDDIIDHFPADIDYGRAHDFSLENLSLAEVWKPVRTGFSQIEGSENLIPDITTWIDATLVLSPKAHRLLGELLMPFGEFVPVFIDREIYQIFNCLTVVDVVEEQSSDSNITFDESSVADKLVFKTPYQSCMNVYCLPRLKDLVESLGLTGVSFDTHLGLFEA